MSLNASFHAVLRDLNVDAKHDHTDFTGDYITLNLATDIDVPSLTLFLNPDQAEQIAKALLSQVQQIQEKEFETAGELDLTL